MKGLQSLIEVCSLWEVFELQMFYFDTNLVKSIEVIVWMNLDRNWAEI